MERGACQATVQGVAESDMTEWLTLLLLSISAAELVLSGYVLQNYMGWGGQKSLHVRQTLFLKKLTKEVEYKFRINNKWEFMVNNKWIFS